MLAFTHWRTPVIYAGLAAYLGHKNIQHTVSNALQGFLARLNPAGALPLSFALNASAPQLIADQKRELDRGEYCIRLQMGEIDRLRGEIKNLVEWIMGERDTLTCLQNVYNDRRDDACQ